MMINKRLIGTVKESKKYIALNVAIQWCSLAANVVMMAAISVLLASMAEKNVTRTRIYTTIIIAVAAVVIRFLCAVGMSKMSYLSSKAVKKTLREKIYEKLLKLGTSYQEKVQTSEVVQVAVEGVDQLETYFGAYLPQFFYAMIAPLTLFVILCFINVPSAVVLLICVPLIPVAIAAVQTWAKKLLSKYWGRYTALGDTFLENLQGLTTLKIYQADEFKHKQMNEASEEFRKITMKVLTMQLNSITIMDLIAYGGAALGIVMSVTQFKAGHIGLAGAIFIILLSADFFIPMRQLGSFFHIAMNGMASSDKIFKLLDLPEDNNENGKECPKDGDIVCKNLAFSYDDDREILHGIDMVFKSGSFTAVVGESGCGKSTLGRTIMKIYEPTGGEIFYRGQNITKLSNKKMHNLRKSMQMIFQDPYASLNPRFTIGDIIEEPMVIHNMYTKAERKEKVYELLELVGLKPDHIRRYPHEFSGGQRQRVGIARTLALNPDFIVCDEPISALDVSIQAQIINLLEKIQDEQGISYLFIAHDLGMVKHISHKIGVMYLGHLVEFGDADEVYNHPLHPYTEALMSAAPIPDPKLARESKRIMLKGEIPSPLDMPTGCPFASRCPRCREECLAGPPIMVNVGDRKVACFDYL